MNGFPGAAVAKATPVMGLPDFASWVRPHLVPMANLAARMVGAADRDDVVQESLARAWRRFETFDERRGTPRSWLLAIVADRARRHNRRRLRPAFVAAATTALDLDSGADLAASIAKLPRRQRMAVELHYFVDLPVDEVAQVMGCAEGTVKSTLHDARARLRRALEER